MSSDAFLVFAGSEKATVEVTRWYGVIMRFHSSGHARSGPPRLTIKRKGSLWVLPSRSASTLWAFVAEATMTPVAYAE